MKLRNILWVVLLAVAPFTWAARQDMRIMTFNIRHGGIDVSIGNGQNTWENRALAIIDMWTLCSLTSSACRRLCAHS